MFQDFKMFTDCKRLCRDVEEVVAALGNVIADELWLCAKMRLQGSKLKVSIKTFSHEFIIFMNMPRILHFWRNWKY